MQFPGFAAQDVALFNAVMSAVIRDVIAYDLSITSVQIAERFVEAVLSGERDFQRLKARTLGAENASGNGSHTN